MAQDELVEYTNRGERMKIAKKQVIEKLKNADLGRMDIHYVEIEGKKYPLKKAFAEVTGLDLLDFQTAEARSVFRKLKFKVARND